MTTRHEWVRDGIGTPRGPRGLAKKMLGMGKNGPAGRCPQMAVPRPRGPRARVRERGWEREVGEGAWWVQRWAVDVMPAPSPSV